MQEYVTWTQVSKLHGGKYHSALYDNHSFYGLCQKAISDRLFEAVWEKIAASPTLVVCADEADGSLGIRVQYLVVEENNTRPGSALLQIKALSDFMLF